MEEEESELTEFFFLNVTFCFALLSFLKKKIKKQPAASKQKARRLLMAEAALKMQVD